MTVIIVVFVLLVIGAFVWKSKFSSANVTHAVYDVNEVPVYASTRTGAKRRDEDTSSNGTVQNAASAAQTASAAGAVNSSAASGTGTTYAGNTSSTTAAGTASNGGYAQNTYTSAGNISAGASSAQTSQQSQAAQTENTGYKSYNQQMFEKYGYVVRDAEPKPASAEQLQQNYQAENSSEYWAEVARREAAAAARADTTRNTVGIPATETGNLISYAQKEFNFDGVESDLFGNNGLDAFSREDMMLSSSPDADGWSDIDASTKTSELIGEATTGLVTPPGEGPDAKKEHSAKAVFTSVKDTIKENVFKKGKTENYVDVTAEGVIRRDEFRLKKPFTILAVTDDLADKNLLKEYADIAGVTVDFVDNGIKCLDRVKVSEYAVILIPRYMPRMDGLQTLRNLENLTMNRCYGARMYAVINEDHDESDEFLLQSGFAGIIRKPFGKYTFIKFLIENSEKADLPDDKDLLREAVAMARQEEKLQKSGISFTAGMKKFGGNLKLYRRSALEFCKEYDEKSDKLMAFLDGNDERGYMNMARDLRDQASGLGALYLADMLDDHVNIAKEDSLEVAASNWPTLVQKWFATVKAFRVWLGFEEFGDIKGMPLKSNGIKLSNRDLKAMLNRALLAIDAGNISSEAKEIIDSASEYDLSPDVRNILFELLRDIDNKNFQVVKLETKKLMQNLI